MHIRTETQADYERVYQLNFAAFGNRPDEAELVERIRKSDAFVPELSIVAEDEGEIAGHALLSRAIVDNNEQQHTVIVLAPVAVAPARQRQGVGTRLIQEGIRRCRQYGYGLILLIGHSSYYPRLGFQPARPYGLELKQFEVPDEVFMVCEVVEGQLEAIHGELKYPQTFFN